LSYLSAESRAEGAGGLITDCRGDNVLWQSFVPQDVLGNGLTAQPWRTCYQPVKALKVRPAIPISHIVCTGWDKTPFLTPRFAEMKDDPGVWTATLNASHLCMLTAAADTVAALSHQHTTKR
jgi:hypothetical protein